MRPLLISLFIIVADQFSKIFVKGIDLGFLHLNGLPYGESYPVLGNLFNITFIENPGIAFGIDFGEEFRTLVTILTIVTCLLLLVYFYLVRKENFYVKASVAMIIGGALGNLVDRIFYGVIYGYAPLFQGKVVDFFDLNFFNLHLFNRTLGSYIFNVADVAVSIGVVFLIISLRRKRKKENQSSVAVENLLAENQE